MPLSGLLVTSCMGIRVAVLDVDGMVRSQGTHSVPSCVRHNHRRSQGLSRRIPPHPEVLTCGRDKN